MGSGQVNWARWPRPNLLRLGSLACVNNTNLLGLTIQEALAGPDSFLDLLRVLSKVLWRLTRPIPLTSFTARTAATYLLGALRHTLVGNAKLLRHTFELLDS